MTKSKRVWKWSGKKFKEARKKSPFPSHGKFCEAMHAYVPDLCKSVIFYWENRSEPSSTNLMAICEVLKVDPWALAE